MFLFEIEQERLFFIIIDFKAFLRSFEISLQGFLHQILSVKSYDAL